MNEWIKRSIELANKKGYLDKLTSIYKVDDNPERELTEERIEELKKAYENRDALTLIKILIKLDKFPIDDPYIAYFRRHKSAINENPKTIERVGKRLFSFEFDDLIIECKRPKVVNRQIGVMFHKWLPELGYPILEKEEFEAHEDEIAILKGSDEYLKNYANWYLKAKVNKGLDFLGRVGDKFVIGEAKFLCDFGGHQNAQFQDALRVLGGHEGKAIRIAILDGVVWIEGRNKMHRRIKEVDGIALSALLLKEFLESLK